MKQVLIAGIGNLFHGDDGFGVHVARRAALSPLPEGIDVVDFGIRGLDLAYALTSGYRLAVLVDTVQRGGPPGTLYVIDPDVGAVDADDLDNAPVSPHRMDPANVLRFASMIGGERASVILVGCEPATFGDPDLGCMELSDAVAAAVGEAAAMVSVLAANGLREARRIVARSSNEEPVQ